MTFTQCSLNNAKQHQSEIIHCFAFKGIQCVCVKAFIIKKKGVANVDTMILNEYVLIEIALN